MIPYGWEGNRRSGVALATRHRLQWFIRLRAQWLTEGKWAPRLHFCKEYGTALPFYLLANPFFNTAIG